MRLATRLCEHQVRHLRCFRALHPPAAAGPRRWRCPPLPRLTPNGIRTPCPQDGGKFRVSRKAVLTADGFVPPPPSPAPSAAGSESEEGEAVEVGRIYRACRVKNVTEWGAFVEVGGRAALRALPSHGLLLAPAVLRAGLPCRRLVPR